MVVAIQIDHAPNGYTWNSMTLVSILAGCTNDVLIEGRQWHPIRPSPCASRCQDMCSGSENVRENAKELMVHHQWVFHIYVSLQGDEPSSCWQGQLPDIGIYMSKQSMFEESQAPKSGHFLVRKPTQKRTLTLWQHRKHTISAADFTEYGEAGCESFPPLVNSHSYEKTPILKGT